MQIGLHCLNITVSSSQVSSVRKPACVYYSTLDNYMHPTMSASTNLEAPLEALLLYSPIPPVLGVPDHYSSPSLRQAQCNCICEYETDFLHLSFPPTGISQTPLLTACLLNCHHYISASRFHLGSNYNS